MKKITIIIRLGNFLTFGNFSLDELRNKVLHREDQLPIAKKEFQAMERPDGGPFVDGTKATTTRRTPAYQTIRRYMQQRPRRLRHAKDGRGRIRGGIFTK